MSHIETLSELKNICEDSGQCNEYQTQLQHEESDIDAYTANVNQLAMTWGVIVGLIGLIILLTPFIKSLRRFKRFALPKLVIAAPIVIGIIVGALFGVGALLITCFGQKCSSGESTAWFIIPIIVSLAISIPISQNLYQERKKLTKRINAIKPTSWVVWGALIIALAMAGAISHVRVNNENNTLYKAELRNLPHDVFE